MQYCDSSSSFFFLFLFKITSLLRFENLYYLMRNSTRTKDQSFQKRNRLIRWKGVFFFAVLSLVENISRSTKLSFFYKNLVNLNLDYLNILPSASLNLSIYLYFCFQFLFTHFLFFHKILFLSYTLAQSLPFSLSFFLSS